jgi:hypothetical protein
MWWYALHAYASITIRCRSAGLLRPSHSHGEHVCHRHQSQLAWRHCEGDLEEPAGGGRGGYWSQGVTTWGLYHEDGWAGRKEGKQVASTVVHGTAPAPWSRTARSTAHSSSAPAALVPATINTTTSSPLCQLTRNRWALPFPRCGTQLGNWCRSQSSQSRRACSCPHRTCTYALWGTRVARTLSVWAQVKLMCMPHCCNFFLCHAVPSDGHVTALHMVCPR